MTRAELEAKVIELEKTVEILRREQEGDVLRFKELEIIALKFKESALYLKVIVNFGKWTLRISGTILAVIAWIKRSQIWQFLNQL